MAGIESTSWVRRVEAAKIIARSGLQDLLLYQKIAGLLVAGYTLEDEKNHTDEMAWMCKALAASGDPAYREAFMQVRINGVQIGYDDFGQGPVVFFIHDYLLNRQIWSPQVEPLVAAGFRVILTDLRGCGESDLTEEPVALQTYSADIIGLLDYLGIGRAAVCELSFGGSVLCNLLENYPQRIAGAYLATSRSIQAPQGKIPVETLKIVGHQSDETKKIPTLLTGTECNPITHQKQTELIASQTLKSDRASILDGGRLVNMENVQEFNRHLLEFLTNLAPRRRGALMTRLSSAA
jgi:hypothetical protein